MGEALSAQLTGSGSMCTAGGYDNAFDLAMSGGSPPCGSLVCGENTRVRGTPLDCEGHRSDTTIVYEPTDACNDMTCDFYTEYEVIEFCNTADFGTVMLGLSLIVMIYDYLLKTCAGAFNLKLRCGGGFGLGGGFFEGY